MNSPGQEVPNMLLEISREITPERMKREPKQKQHPAVDVTDDGSKFWCCKEQYCIGTWNVKSMNKGKLEVVKQEMVRANINILGIRELKWTVIGEFNSDNHYIYYHGQESLRSNGGTIIVYKRVQNAVQFSSVTQSCLTVCDPMNHSMPGLPVHHQLPESTQTHVHCVGDALQPSHPLLSPSPPALNLSSIRVFSNELALPLWWPKHWFQLQHQSFQWILRTDFL